jgi:hypothetical protein
MEFVRLRHSTLCLNTAQAVVLHDFVLVHHIFLTYNRSHAENCWRQRSVTDAQHAKSAHCLQML